MKIKILQDSNFTGKKICHGFFTKAGGVSRGIYESLNLGLGSKDSRKNVLLNRQIVCDYLSIPSANLLTIHQVHSTKCIFANKPFGENRPKVDAIVTNQQNLALGILTADCCPILFADEKAGIIGAAHAGWKGALGNIMESTICEMERQGSSRQNIRAILGPTISQKNYEVGAEFSARFLAQSSENERFFHSKKNHYFFDLAGYIAYRLEISGVLSRALASCTYENEGDFFSYRRSQHGGQADYGRQISVIMLKK